MTGGPIDFNQLKPRLRLVLELYRNAANEETRKQVESLCDDVFLAAVWNVATDLLDNGWEPTLTSVDRSRTPHLRVAKG